MAVREIQRHVDMVDELMEDLKRVYRLSKWVKKRYIHSTNEIIRWDKNG